MESKTVSKEYQILYSRNTQNCVHEKHEVLFYSAFPKKRFFCGIFYIVSSQISWRHYNLAINSIYPASVIQHFCFDCLFCCLGNVLGSGAVQRNLSLVGFFFCNYLISSNSIVIFSEKNLPSSSQYLSSSLFILGFLIQILLFRNRASFLFLFFSLSIFILQFYFSSLHQEYIRLRIFMVLIQDGSSEHVACL